MDKIRTAPVIFGIIERARRPGCRPPDEIDVRPDMSARRDRAAVAREDKGNCPLPHALHRMPDREFPHCN
jgi:hypothetical protein